MKLLIKGAYSIATDAGFSVHPKVIELLKEVDITGSLNSAVANIGMSYSYAWNLINKTNCKLESPLIITKRGGNGGGVALLTPTGKALLEYCEKFEQEFNDFIGTHHIDIK